ncbi:uncharacterized protein YycO [Paenibacillus sp. SORGH_AS306]|uniref:hypothetical protein n=1 Tax=unclassified Paenibacillus TaxID=185978 RepID=UPI00278625EA|nr:MULTISPECIES: hypothetical protein [unclassified Paenibacillus]MDQ1235546.1 uncharacterized protein YycO [Paenibacillus sp. SORGH_AS_0306]MDR6112594.1 uncharacterized protein YycO [Paenibacillus sp. SORGH_AS_0338]
MKLFKVMIGIMLFLGLYTSSFGTVNANSSTSVTDTYSTNNTQVFTPSVTQNVYSNNSFEIAANAVSTLTYRGTSLAVRPGDVLVTNSTSSNGLTGHAGIVVNDQGTVVTINGYNNDLAAENMTQWNSKNVRVMRYSNTNAASKAAAWAKNYYHTYKGKVHYGLVNTIGSYEKETYCSKIIWDSYYFGSDITIDGHTPYWNGIYAPYYFLTQSGFTQITAWGQNF